MEESYRLILDAVLKLSLLVIAAIIIAAISKLNK